MNYEKLLNFHLSLKSCLKFSLTVSVLQDNIPFGQWGMVKETRSHSRFKFSEDLLTVAIGRPIIADNSVLPEGYDALLTFLNRVFRTSKILQFIIQYLTVLCWVFRKE